MEAPRALTVSNLRCEILDPQYLFHSGHLVRGDTGENAGNVSVGCIVTTNDATSFRPRLTLKGLYDPVYIANVVSQ